MAEETKINKNFVRAPFASEYHNSAVQTKPMFHRSLIHTTSQMVTLEPHSLSISEAHGLGTLFKSTNTGILDSFKRQQIAKNSAIQRTKMQTKKGKKREKKQQDGHAASPRHVRVPQFDTSETD